MAITEEYKEKRLKTIHIFDSVIKTVNTRRINESIENGLSTLKDIELFLSNKELPYLQCEELEDGFNNNDYSIFIKIMFLSNKHKQVGNNNFVSFGFDISEDKVENKRLRGRVSYLESCESIDSFAGLPKYTESKDFQTVGDISKLCDYIGIYNRSIQNAMDIIRRRVPQAYYMFNGTSITKRMSNNGTLGVYFDKVTRKYVYMYNPKFILELALDEWCQNFRSGKYSNLRECYEYCLAFLITHEMMHIIHHNTKTSVDNEDVGGHEYVNMVNDSFINCHISRVFRGTLKNTNEAPMPKSGIGSSIHLRGRHNVGFKKYNSVAELASEMFKSITGVDNLSSVDMYGNTNYDISQFENADICLTIDINPYCDVVRKNSNIFQRSMNNLIKCITDSEIYNIQEELSDDELVSDLDILQNGTLVRVVRSSDIGIIVGYDETNGKYSVNNTNYTGEDIVNTPEGNVVVPKYEDSGDKKGDYFRKNIIPVDLESLSWSQDESQSKDSLSDEDLVTPPTPPGGDDIPNIEEPKNTSIKNIKVGDTVWCRRKRLYGLVKEVSQGKFKLELVDEGKSEVIDEKDGVKLVKRNFNPTGVSMGYYNASELDPIDNPYVKRPENEDNTSGKKNKQSPNDQPPPPPIDDDENEDKKGKLDQDLDLGADRDIDDKDESDPLTDDEGNGSYSPDDEDTDDSAGQDGQGGQDGQDNQDNQNGQDGQGGQEGQDGQKGQDNQNGQNGSGGQNSQNDIDDGEDTDNDEDTNNGGEGNQNNTSDIDKSNMSNKSSAGSGGSGDGTDNGESRIKDLLSNDGKIQDNPENGKSTNKSIEDYPDYDDYNDGEDNEDTGKSDIEKAIENARQGESSVSKEKRYNDSQNTNNNDTNNNIDTGTSKEEKKLAQDMLGKAIEEAESDQKSMHNTNNPYDTTSLRDNINGLLDSMGAGSITSLFKSGNAKDWKSKLEQLFDSATGFDIVTNPNLINKKIEDAPPGREDENPTINSVLVMLDCSGSMGAEEFKKVIAHVNTMLKVRKMDSVNFHIMAWGDDSLSTKSILSNYYEKVKGRKFKQTIMKYKAQNWNTYIDPPCIAAMQKVRKPDAILIMTDGDFYVNSKNKDIVCKFFKKYRKKVIWVLTQNSLNAIKQYDKNAVSDKRYIIFKGK